jgi:protein-S-isoprenylcysteine O-methyltransferase Ste14
LQRSRTFILVGLGAVFVSLVAIVVLASLFPSWVRYHLGDSFICAFVYLWLALAFPRVRPARLLAATAAIAVTAEWFQLVRTPALNAFRRTFVGQMTIGGLFDWLDFAFYAIGCLAIWAADRAGLFVSRRRRSGNDPYAAG